ncbi:hypothetical protein A3H38_03245 [candidate division WOR-1 bacterium RIFCSPLOWO2_02_FULL_46_20]|uniref:Uncharacterized protein n=2 Tax=Saganbacteria TaxID=1703751 RepID=A0A1F4RG67_UNCSA|nr:MAG: hypothetical protein A3H38_03245 [candidate division WOR-1 bacterium RIFCSPLOWO2_02_FULL_46_20]OGC09950.1 MAG: hypothetical protein A3F86_02980 [candidate division WOR-1 bacterium RIFCSPLOWO2_12_FULL_45_9]
MKSTDIIDKNFREVTYDLKELYCRLSDEILSHENEKRGGPGEYNAVVYSKAKENFSSLKHLYNKTWELLVGQGLEDQINPLHQLYRSFFQKEIHAFFLVSPFCRRVFQKPLGYAGDFRMLKYIYDDQLEGENLFAKLIHYFSINLEIAQAVKNRKNYILSKIAGQRKDADFSFMSVASGPAVEVVELMKDNSSMNGSIHLLDSEIQALKSVKGQINNEVLKKKKISLICHHNSIYDIIKNRMDVKKQNLIYTTGLFDYLSDRIASRLIDDLFSLLKTNGVLIIGNLKHTGKVLRAYMELLGEWFLNYRNEEQLLGLAHNVADKAKISIERDSTGIQLFLLIEKMG